MTLESHSVEENFSFHFLAFCSFHFRYIIDSFLFIVLEQKHACHCHLHFVHFVIPSSVSRWLHGVNIIIVEMCLPYILRAQQTEPVSS